jgi:hypothetical protein
VTPTETVNSLINCLTNDEEQRQDLWVHYLSGNPPSSFASHLSKIDKEFSIDIELQQLLWQVFITPPTDKFKELLSRFSDIEQSALCLLALGLSISKISCYKGISEVRIRQLIAIIGYNSAWDNIYGTKNKAHRRRKVRVK